MVKTNARLYKIQMCFAGSGVAEVRLDEPFLILIANFSEQPIILLPKQFFAQPTHNWQTTSDRTYHTPKWLG